MNAPNNVNCLINETYILNVLGDLVNLFAVGEYSIVLSNC